ncbi:hypothetical protein [Phenylobacterium sp.]|jgi:hypothetical protein|uniref:hypothetical protein n=1 Tax=Phenylobacterium sp. TaxID=1871053 RepID=UPI002E36CCBE|nr:hypothetical protein [Phenylobacterium sp.]HEX3365559.1 hypothetical protein [Phenylobacterium sp.]
MISRRSLLTGMSLIPLAGGIVGCAARAGGLAAAPLPGGAIPVVGPGTRWNGTPLSGGTPPIDPVRTTAKPAVHWLVPSDLRLVSNLTIGVDADAKGGLKQVDFWVEGQVQTVTAPSIFTDTDANGNSRSRYGYWITLNASAFKIISTTGEARLYATAMPNDTTMQSRVIGYDLVNGGLTDGNYPVSVFPRAVANDFTLNVRLDGAGGAYTSLNAAIAAAKTINTGGAPAEAPLIVFQQTGTYAPVDIGSIYGGGKGFCTITHAAGITATIARTSFTPNNSSTWRWTPGWDGIEFRGAGILFDMKNWCGFVFSSKAAWFNGCKFTSSAGSRDTVYWNGGPPYSSGEAGANLGAGPTAPSYWDDVYVEYVSGMMQAQRYCQGTQHNSVYGDVFSGTHYLARNYTRFTNSDFYHNNLTMLSVLYTNPGGHTTATVTKTGSDGATSTFSLQVDGTTVLGPLTLGKYIGDANLTIQDLANTINTFGNGFSATVGNGRGSWRASVLGGEGGGSNPTVANCFGVTVAITGYLGIHADWWQGYDGSNATRQNVIMRGNIARDGAFSGMLNNDDVGNPNDNSWDHILKGNVWLGTADVPTGFGNTAATQLCSHYVFENNVHEPAVARFQGNGGDKVYSSAKNNIIGGAYTNQSGTFTWTDDAPWINNFYTPSYQGPMTGGGNAGNVAVTTFSALFVDYANGDVRPAVGGALLSNLFPKVNALDGRLNAFASTDVIGAWAKGDPPYTYPF